MTTSPFLKDFLVRYDASPFLNRIGNHSGAYYAAGWSSAHTLARGGTPNNSDGTQMVGVANGVIDTKSYLSVTTTVSNTTTTVLSDKAPVIPGESCSWSVYAGDDPSQHSGTTYRFLVRLNFYDGAGTLLGQTTERTLNRSLTTRSLERVGAGTASGDAQAVPVGAATARLQIRAQTTAGAALPVGAVFYLAQATVLASTVPADVAGIPTRPDPATGWSEIGGTLTSCRIRRGGDLEGATDKIEAGTLTLVMRGSTVDPATVPSLKRGRMVQVFSGADTGRKYNQKLFEGYLSTVDADYSDKKGLGRPRITLTASDQIVSLRGVQWPYANVPDLTPGVTPFFERVRQMIALAAPPRLRMFVDYATAYGNLIVNRDDSATLWDQMVRARDGFIGARLWVSRNGELRIEDVDFQGTIDSPLLEEELWTFSGDPGAALSFTELDLSSGSAKVVVNSLTITKSAYGEGENNEKVYGPYTNEASISEWGAISDDIQVSDGSPADLAAFYLKRLANASRLPRRLKFNVEKAPGAFHDGAHGDPRWVDVYDKARVILTSKGLDATLYVIGIEHDITSERWSCELTLRPLDAGAANVVSVPVTGANTGPADTYGRSGGPLARRERGSTFSVPNTTWTTLPHEIQLNADRITYAVDGTHTITLGGRYIVLAQATYTANATGFRGLRVVRNAQVGNPEVTAYAPASSITGSVLSVQLNAILLLAAGDKLQLQTYQSSGAALLVAADNQGQTFFHLTYLGD